MLPGGPLSAPIPAFILNHTQSYTGAGPGGAGVLMCGDHWQREVQSRATRTTRCGPGAEPRDGHGDVYDPASRRRIGDSSMQYMQAEWCSRPLPEVTGNVAGRRRRTDHHASMHYQRTFQSIGDRHRDSSGQMWNGCFNGTLADGGSQNTIALPRRTACQRIHPICVCSGFEGRSPHGLPRSPDLGTVRDSG